MGLFPSSAIDPLRMAFRTDQDPAGGITSNAGEPFDLSIYTAVYPGLVAGQTTGIILTYDQSNGANFVDSVYTMTMANCHMLDPFTGGMFNIKEPMVGCNGGRTTEGGFNIGNVWSQTIDKLRGASSATYSSSPWPGRQRVIICCLGAGGTTSTQWAAGGDCNNRLKVGARRLLQKGLVPHVVFRHQGESDATSIDSNLPEPASNFSVTKIRDNIRSEVATLRAEGVMAPVIVCQVGYYSTASAAGGGTTGYNMARAGQAAAASPALGIFTDLTTDDVGASGRSAADDLHWNATGRDIVSSRFANAIKARVP